MSLQITPVQQHQTLEIEDPSSCFSFMCTPWNYQGSTAEKIASWACFFFAGCIYHPISALCRAITQLCEWLTTERKINAVVNTPLFNNPVSNTLAGFNNPRVAGHVHGIYITTNESNLNATHQRLGDLPRLTAPTIHIGCATWHNLDIICARSSTYGLIVDFNPKNAKFMQKTIQLVQDCASRDTFKQAMIDYLNSLEGSERGLFFHSDQHGLPTTRIERELQREGSWLSSDENYLYIKQQLTSRDRLIAITEDIRNVETFDQIRGFLDDQHIAVDTLYMSNICNFMTTANCKQAFLQSIKRLVNPQTLFISCPKRIDQETQRMTLLEQKTVSGEELLAGSYDSSRLFEEVVN